MKKLSSLHSEIGTYIRPNKLKLWDRFLLLINKSKLELRYINNEYFYYKKICDFDNIESIYSNKEIELTSLQKQ